jgi:hypothetical protein
MFPVWSSVGTNFFSGFLASVFGPAIRADLFGDEVARLFSDAVVAEAGTADLLSGEHFSADGTLIEAWASLKSLRAKATRNNQPSDDPKTQRSTFIGTSRTTIRTNRPRTRMPDWHARQ